MRCQLHGHGTNKPHYVRFTFRLHSAHVPLTFRPRSTHVLRPPHSIRYSTYTNNQNYMRPPALCVPLYAFHHMRATIMRADYTGAGRTNLSTFGLRSVYVPPTFRPRSTPVPRPPKYIKHLVCQQKQNCMRSIQLCVPPYAFHCMRATMMRSNYTETARANLLTLGLRSACVPFTCRPRCTHVPRLRIRSNLASPTQDVCVQLYYAFRYMRSTTCVPRLCVPITRTRHGQASLRSVYVPSTLRLRSVHVPPAIH